MTREFAVQTSPSFARMLARSAFRRSIRTLNHRKQGSIHLFLLSPPLCGSTALAQLVRTSRNATVFPGSGEGQFLPEAQELMGVDQRWDPDLEIDWPRIREIFLSYWSPLRPIRFEKSPPNLVRALDLERTFEDAYFLVTVRNPYAQIEGLLRRGWPFGIFGPQTTQTAPVTPRLAAEFWARTASFQIKNLSQLERTCFFRYEDLTESTNATIERIVSFVPGLESVNINTELTAHNVTGMPIKGLTNLNQKKIDNLEAEQIAEINGVLERHSQLLKFFQYDLIETPGSRRQALTDRAQ